MNGISADGIAYSDFSSSFRPAFLFYRKYNEDIGKIRAAKAGVREVRGFV
jgi:hypothetical protein